MQGRSYRITYRKSHGGRSVVRTWLCAASLSSRKARATAFCKALWRWRMQITMETRSIDRRRQILRRTTLRRPSIRHRSTVLHSKALRRKAHPIGHPHSHNHITNRKRRLRTNLHHRSTHLRRRRLSTSLGHQPQGVKAVSTATYQQIRYDVTRHRHSRLCCHFRGNGALA